MTPRNRDSRAQTDPMKFRQTSIKSLVRVWQAGCAQGLGFVAKDAYGRRIVTAAHCVPVPKAHGVGRCDILAGVRSFTGRSRILEACLVAWEPCVDVAVLGVEALSGALSPDWEKLNALLSNRHMLPIGVDTTRFDDKCFVQVGQHTGEWIRGTVKIARQLTVPTILEVRFDHTVLPGTSGSPAFTDDGLIVGVISTNDQLAGRGPSRTAQLNYLAGALPGWVLPRMAEDPQRRSRAVHMGAPPRNDTGALACL